MVLKDLENQVIADLSKKEENEEEMEEEQLNGECIKKAILHESKNLQSFERISREKGLELKNLHHRRNA